MRKTFLRVRQVTCDQKFNHANEQKKLAPLRAKNDVTHEIPLKMHERMNKSRFEVVVTSYGRNKNLDDEIKNIAGRIPEATRSVKTSEKT